MTRPASAVPQSGSGQTDSGDVTVGGGNDDVTVETDHTASCVHR